MAESVFVHVQCDKELREAFKNKAEESDRQISQLIRGFMRDYVNGETGAPVSIEEKSLPFQRKWDPSEEKAMKRALKQDTRSEAEVYLSPSDFRDLSRITATDIYKRTQQDKETAELYYKKIGVRRASGDKGPW